jgi:Leucine-rich repeat (LRR) protein
LKSCAYLIFSLLELFLVSPLSVTQESNRLVGSLPEEISSLSNIVRFDIVDNELGGLIPFWDTWLQLEFVRVSGNQFTGSIPYDIKVSKLTHLDLSNNMLDNEIPSSIGRLTELRELDLQGNKLVGTLPSTIGQLTNIKELFVGRNKELTGSLPPSLSNLFKLVTLEFQDNRFNGSLPNDLGNLTELERVEGSNNELTGSIPWSSFAPQSPMVYLALFNNRLNDTLPPNIGSVFPFLQALSLHTNMISGPLPESLGLLTKLKYLTLQKNQMTTTIPTSLGLLKSLFVLNLGGNQAINGTIPTEIGSMESLSKFEVAHWKLEPPLLPVSKLGCLPFLSVSQTFCSWIFVH